VLLVVAHHAELPWAPFPIELGLVGVRLFFVLSGFLITGILLDGRDAIDEGRASRGSFARAFYARRALRIFPVFYAALAILFVLDAPLVREQIGWHALYASSFLVAREGHWVGVASHFWSLSVEEIGRASCRERVS
jgi:peptidoglycan/LPS O-acetylase OafA/YrhL